VPSRGSAQQCQPIRPESGDSSSRRRTYRDQRLRWSRLPCCNRSPATSDRLRPARSGYVERTEYRSPAPAPAPATSKRWCGTRPGPAQGRQGVLRPSPTASLPPSSTCCAESSGLAAPLSGFCKCTQRSNVANSDATPPGGPRLDRPSLAGNYQPAGGHRGPERPARRKQCRNSFILSSALCPRLGERQLRRRCRFSQSCRFPRSRRSAVSDLAGRARLRAARTVRLARATATGTVLFGCSVLDCQDGGVDRSGGELLACARVRVCAHTCASSRSAG
jgi:hypothetical protein